MRDVFGRSSPLPYLLTVTVALGAACALGIGCTDEAVPSVSNSNNIIFVLPNTGSFAAKGAEHTKALELAFNRIVQAGGETRPLLIHTVDAGDKAETCQPRLEAKIRELGVNSIAGIITSTTGAQRCALPFVLDPTSPLQVKVPVIETSSGSDLLEIGPKDAAGARKRLDTQWAIATRPLCGPEPRFTADYVTNEITKTPERFQRIALIRGSQAHDKGHITDFRKYMTAKGFTGQLVGDSNGAELEVPNEGPFEPQIQAALAQNPTAIYYHLNGDTNNLEFLSAAKRVGFTGTIITCGMARSTTLLDPLKAQNITSYLAGVEPALPGGRLHFMMRGPIRSPALDKFKNDFRAFTRQSNVDAYSPATYDAAMLFGLALSIAGPNNPEKTREIMLGLGSGGKKFSHDDAAGMLAALRAGEDVDYDGAGGDLDFVPDDKNGALVSGEYYGEVIVQKGSVYEYSIPQGSPTQVLKAEPLNAPKQQSSQDAGVVDGGADGGVSGG